MTDGQDPALDPTSTLARVGGNLALLRQLADVFRDDCTRLVGAIRDAVGSGDAAGLRQAAHTLKGGAANLGARPLAALCALVEKQAREGSTEGVEEVLAEAGRQVEDVCRALQAEVRGAS